MRHLFRLALLPLALCLLFGCEAKIDTNEPADEEVSVYFIFNLSTDNGSSMTKVTNEEVFSEFYGKIVSAELVAPNYSLTLTETSTGARYEFNGSWNSHSMVTVRTGKYHVVGTSTASGESIQEKCSFIFDETIEISASSSEISLTAQYDCSLLIFSSNEISSLSNYDGEQSHTFFTFKSYKYAFVNGSLYKEGKQNDAYIGGVYTDGAEFKCYTGNLFFEKGKYYVYSSVSGGFNVPPMEEGGGQYNWAIVDLGLSVKWASVNIGAEVETDYGDRYAWGEIAPKTSFTWGNYKWCNGTEYSMTKYCTNSSYGTVDNLAILKDEDDAAQVVWGGGWRMPTVEEAQELRDNCTWVTETNNGVKGYRITAKNSNSIFIPLNGQHDESGVHYTGTYMNVWLNQCNGGIYGYVLSASGVGASNHRHDGLCIRPVCK